MRRRAPPVLILALAVAVLLLARDPGPGGGSRAVVARAVDGDTLKVTVGGRLESVRVLGIDTPETHRPGTPVECGGPQASAAMARLAPVGAAVVLEPDSGQDRRDRYGRLLAYVRLGDGRSAGAEQVRAGWAESYVYDGHPVARYGSLRRLEADARHARRGVWGLCGGSFHSAEEGP